MVVMCKHALCVRQAVATAASLGNDIGLELGQAQLCFCGATPLILNYTSRTYLSANAGLLLHLALTRHYLQIHRKNITPEGLWEGGRVRPFDPAFPSDCLCSRQARTHTDGG